jgi:Zn-dependent protease/predicted transcriptional regulator
VWRSGSLRIGYIGGIAVDVHITFLLIIAWGAWQGWAQYGSIPGALFGISAIVLLFICVLLHELGHAFQAKAYRLVVLRVTLLPVGGLAQLAAPPSRHWQEMIIALAGPAVNLILAALLGGVVYTLYQPFTINSWFDLLYPLMQPSLLGLVLYLLGANITLFLFNMLPAFPMDGGRVVRSGLALFLDYEMATRIAAWLGRAMAIAMGLMGLIGVRRLGIPANPLIVLVAIIIYFGAQQEEYYVRRQRALVRVEVGDAMRMTRTVTPADTLTPSLARALAKNDQILPVVVADKLVGLLSYGDLRRLENRAAQVTVAHLMRTHYPTLSLHDTLWVALQEMNAHKLAALPVVHEGTFCGIVSAQDINRAWRYLPRRRQHENATLLSGGTSPQ